MDRAIWKFSLGMDGFQFIEPPDGAEFLSVQPQGNGVCLWALVNPENVKHKRGIWIFGTGHTIAAGLDVGRYISTFQLNDGALVFHAFEAKP